MNTKVCLLFYANQFMKETNSYQNTQKTNIESVFPKRHQDTQILSTHVEEQSCFIVKAYEQHHS